MVQLFFANRRGSVSHWSRGHSSPQKLIYKVLGMGAGARE